MLCHVTNQGRIQDTPKPVLVRKQGWVVGGEDEAELVVVVVVTVEG